MALELLILISFAARVSWLAGNACSAVVAIANYNNIKSHPYVLDYYLDTVLQLNARFVDATNVYTTSVAFLRKKRVDGLQARGVPDRDVRGYAGEARRALQFLRYAHVHECVLVADREGSGSYGEAYIGRPRGAPGHNQSHGSSR
jgi:hypothetical protein